MSRHPLDDSRRIVERWVIEGHLVLQTPTHFGNGDSDGNVDMPLLVDEVTGRAVLPGTSLAGALRNYLRERAHGYGVAGPDLEGEKLFGGDKGNDEGEQSSLIVEDALGGLPKIELRDGVRIDPITRTAKIDFRDGRARGYKYDLELLEAGTTFDLRMELLLSNGDSQTNQAIKQTLAVALDGLAQGEIAMGLRKRRGFGRCNVTNWTVTHYDLSTPTGLLAWIAEGHGGWTPASEPMPGEDIAGLLGVQIEDAKDKRRTFHLRADFILESSLLIRAGFGEQDHGPDMVHLHARQPGERAERLPIVSGTSMAGVLRSRANRIIRTLVGDRPKAKEQARNFISSMFGPDEIKKGARNAQASRVVVNETVIQHARELVQNRIRVDRFTGGAFESALFNEQPVFGDDKTCVTVDLSLRKPADAEIGLLLLLLKDLWTGDLALGGESSIGRGRLSGMEATMRLDGKTWRITGTESDSKLAVEGDKNADALEQYVSALKKELIK